MTSKGRPTAGGDKVEIDIPIAAVCITRDGEICNQFIGTAAFSGTGEAEVRFTDPDNGYGGLLLVDRDGNGLADFSVETTGIFDVTAFTQSDFIFRIY